MAEKNENEVFEKKEIVKGSYYSERKVKNEFIKICIRKGTSCNKEINKFIDKFILSNKKISDAKRNY